MTELSQTSTKTPSNPKSSKSGPSTAKPKVPHEEALLALYDVDDLMSRCLTAHLYIVLKDMAEAIKSQTEFDGSELEVGLEKRYIGKEVFDTLRDYSPADAVFTDRGFTYTFGNVPVKVKFIQRIYKFLDNPDRHIFWAGEFNIPNPMEAYRKAKWILT